MNWMNKLQRKLGRNFGIPNLMFILSLCQLLVYFFSPIFSTRGIDLLGLLAFDKTLILQGQVWRFFSYILIPSSTSLFFLFLTLYFQCFIGHYLENEWGTLGITLFYFLGVILTSIGGLISGVAMTSYITMSLFLAFAIMWPNIQFLLFFVIPVKAKYLAYIDWAFFILAIIIEPWPIKLSAILALGNLFIFFGKEYIQRIKDYFRYRKQRKNFKDQMR